MSKCRIFVGILVVLGLSPQAVAATPAPLEEIVAVVNDEIILKTDFIRKLNEAKQALKQSNPGTSPPDPILKQQVLEQLVSNTIQRQMAKELGIEVTDDMLNQALESVAKQNQMSVEAFRATLKQGGIDFSAFKEDLRQEIQINELRRQKIGRQIQASNQEIDNFLGIKQPEVEAHYTLTHYFVPAEALKGDKKKLDEWVSALRKGQDAKWAAAHLKIEFQEKPFEDKRLAELPTIFESVLPRLSVGEISDPIETSTGIHVLKLADKKNQAVTRQPDLTGKIERDKAKEAIQKRKYLEELQNWLIEIRNQAYVDIRLKL